MSNEITGGHCKQCDKDVLITRPGTSHLLHLVISLFTAGLWLIIWVGVAVKFGGYRCTQCGSSKTNRVRG